MAPEYFAFRALEELAIAMETKAQTPDWSLRQCFFFHMGGFVIQSKPQDVDPQRYRIRPKKLLSLFVSGAMSWPIKSDDDINGRSRADWLSKGIAMLQIFSFVGSLLGRWAQDLAITTLELFTLGIVVSAIVTYIASWEKPFDVQAPIVLFSEVSVAKEDCIDRVASISEDCEFVTLWWTVVGPFFTFVMFGGLHLAAWNFHFPTAGEQQLWRFSSTICMALLVCYIPLLHVLDIGNRSVRVFNVFVLLYMVVRIYMFVDMFASLRAVPESVYRTPQMSRYFPSLG